MARRALLRRPRGSLIVVVVDDPLASIDIPHLCHQEGFELVSSERVGEVLRFTLRRPSLANSAKPSQVDL